MQAGFFFNFSGIAKIMARFRRAHYNTFAVFARKSKSSVDSMI